MELSVCPVLSVHTNYTQQASSNVPDLMVPRWWNVLIYEMEIISENHR